MFFKYRPKRGEEENKVLFDYRASEGSEGGKEKKVLFGLRQNFVLVFLIVIILVLLFLVFGLESPKLFVRFVLRRKWIFLFSGKPGKPLKRNT